MQVADDRGPLGRVVLGDESAEGATEAGEGLGQFRVVGVGRPDDGAPPVGRVGLPDDVAAGGEAGRDGLVVPDDRAAQVAAEMAFGGGLRLISTSRCVRTSCSPATGGSNYLWNCCASR